MSITTTGLGWPPSGTAAPASLGWPVPRETAPGAVPGPAVMSADESSSDATVEPGQPGVPSGDTAGATSSVVATNAGAAGDTGGVTSPVTVTHPEAPGATAGVTSPVVATDAGTSGDIVRGQATAAAGSVTVAQTPAPIGMTVPVGAPASAEAAAEAATAVAPSEAAASVGDAHLNGGPALTDTPLARELEEDTRRRRTLLGQRLPVPQTPRVMTMANQKGGVGKTTTAVNMAAALAQGGLSVLVLDLDPQGNTSTALSIPHHAEVPSIYGVLVDGMPLAQALQECPDVPGLWCAPATIDLAGAEIELVSMVARETRLLRALDELVSTRAEAGQPAFDYVIVDCPPSLGLLTVNALVSAREVFIPIQCEYYALEGLSQLLKNIELVKRHLNPTLHVSTILLTMYDGRTRLSSEVAEQVREHFPELVLRASIPRSVRISEAPSHGQTVMTYDPGSSGALSYLEAARELAHRSGHAGSGVPATASSVDQTA